METITHGNVCIAEDVDGVVCAESTTTVTNNDSELEVTGATPNTPSNELVTDENYNTFKLLSLKSKMNDIESIMDDINTRQKQFVSENDDFDPLDELLKNYTEEDLKKMSFDEINKMLVNEDGTPIEFAIDFKGDEHKLNQFKKDFIIMRKQVCTTMDNFDTEIAQINKEIAESQEEFDRAVSEFGNVSALIRHTLEERINNAQDKDTETKYRLMLKEYNHGLNLENIKEFCKSYKGRNIIGDYRIDKQSQYVYRRYLKVAQSLNIKTDLTSFTNLERRFLDTKYWTRPNIFIFAVISYIASFHNKDYSKINGLFVTQFTVNLKNLYYDKFDTAEDKETFINNIMEIIDIIG